MRLNSFGHRENFSRVTEIKKEKKLRTFQNSGRGETSTAQTKAKIHETCSCSAKRHAPIDGVHKKRGLPAHGTLPLVMRKRKRLASLEASLAIRAEGGGFEPPVPIRVRQFSKLVVSATHPSFPSDYSVRSFPAVIGVQMYATNLFSANIFATKYCRMAFSR